MQHTVIGAFKEYAAAQEAVVSLNSSGFRLAHVTEAQAGNSGSTSTSADADDGILAHVSHFFGNLFGGSDQHAAYAEGVRRGGAVVKVEVDSEDEAERARDVLEAAGAVDIDDEGEQWRAQGWTGGAAPVAAQASSTTSVAEGSIPVIKEELEVGKRTVSTGGVRVFARTVSTPVSETVDLRSEHAEVLRRPVNRPATDAELSALQDRTIEVRETAERAVVSKTAHVVEEISVGKKIENRTEDIDDTLRHTEVDVERIGADDASEQRLAGLFRSDYATRYGAADGGYDDYEPAYRYGHSLRNDPRYSGRQWPEVESDARRDWEASNPGGTWDKVKGAVSHAWTSVKS